MCEYKNNKSEEFTAVISLISLYNSVACHETHTCTHKHTLTNSSTCTYIQRCTHTYTHTDLRNRCQDGRKVVMGMDTQITSLVKDREGEKVKTHAHKKEKIYISFSKGRLPSVSSCRVPSPPPDKPKTL